MGMLALIHGITFIIPNWQFVWSISLKPTLWLISGFLALLLTLFLLVTSNDWAVKKMGKWWKRLHRLVYVIFVLVVVHVIALKIIGRPLDLVTLFDILLLPVLLVIIK